MVAFASTQIERTELVKRRRAEARGGSASPATYQYVFASYIDEPVVRKTTGTSGTVLYYHRNQQYSVYALTDSLENCNLQCMKKHPPTGCKPFKDPKKGEPKKDKDGCWVDDSGRTGCPDQPGGHEPHWDVRPPFGKPGDVWDTPCCKCHTKAGKGGDVYTRCFPKNAGI